MIVPHFAVYVNIFLLSMLLYKLLFIGILFLWRSDRVISPSLRDTHAFRPASELAELRSGYANLNFAWQNNFELKHQTKKQEKERASLLSFWSERQDSNLRPDAPKAPALSTAPRPEIVFIIISHFADALTLYQREKPLSIANL